MTEPIIEQVEKFALSKQDRPKAEFAKVGIVGCGSAGQRIAVLIAKRGIDVVFVETSQQKIEEAYNGIKVELNNQLNHWGITESEMKGTINRIVGSTEYKILEGCDLVIESVMIKNKELAIEQRVKIYKEIEKYVSPNTIIATNSSTISVTEIASQLEHKHRCISMHISLTSPEAKLVEYVRSVYTTDEIEKNVQKFAILIGKTFIKVAESAGMISVRLFAPMINDACRLFTEGVASIEKIDAAAKMSMNLPIGPFEMADKIGIDRVVRWLENMYEEFGDLHFKPSPILKRLERAQQTGVKAGKGFYIYETNGNKKPAINLFNI